MPASAFYAFPAFTAHLYQGDLPPDLTLGPVVAIDTETMGLDLRRDRLCLVQLSTGDGVVHLVQIARGQTQAPNLARMLADAATTKLFHFARFDLAVLRAALGVRCAPVRCTKIAAKLTRTSTDRHGLRDLCADLLGVEISKAKQTSDWGAAELSREQIEYAAGDVLHLHRLWDALAGLLRREERKALAEACFAFLPERAELDLLGWEEPDIFRH
jgi:ribonuclease D